LICSDWDVPLNYLDDFPVSGETIYKGKWYSLLFLDVFVAYDYTSVRLLNHDFRAGSYSILMKKIRQDLIDYLNETGITLEEFRCYDNPSEFFNVIPRGSPRPLGNIIDKLYLTL